MDLKDQFKDIPIVQHQINNLFSNQIQGDESPAEFANGFFNLLVGIAHKGDPEAKKNGFKWDKLNKSEDSGNDNN